MLIDINGNIPGAVECSLHLNQRTSHGPTGSLSELLPYTLRAMVTPPEEGFMIPILISFKSPLVLLKITYRLF